MFEQHPQGSPEGGALSCWTVLGGNKRQFILEGFGFFVVIYFSYKISYTFMTEWTIGWQPLKFFPVKSQTGWRIFPTYHSSGTDRVYVKCDFTGVLGQEQETVGMPAPHPLPISLFGCVFSCLRPQISICLALCCTGFLTRTRQWKVFLWFEKLCHLFKEKHPSLFYVQILINDLIE